MGHKSDNANGPYHNLPNSVLKLTQRIWNFRKFKFLEFDHESNHKFTLLAVNMTWNLTITRLTWTYSIGAQ